MTPQEQAQYRQILNGLSLSSRGLQNWLGSSNSYSPSLGAAGQALGTGATGLGIASGIQQGGFKGDTSAAANAARLFGKYGTNFGLSPGQATGLNTGATGALDALALYQGLQRGGVQGYGQAAGAGLQGAGLLLDNPALTTAGGYVMAPLAVYNAVKNWQSGATGSDALNGAEAGAAVGSVVPGIGTAIGAIVGGLAGAASSAFGGGRRDPETTNWQSYVPAANKAGSALSTLLSPSQNFQNLAGVMDAKNNTAGHSQPIEQVFGREGENNLLNGIASQINAGVSNGTINPNMDASQIYSQVITPWLNSKGAGIANQNTAKGDPEGAALNSTLQNLVSQYIGGQITPTTQLGINGQTDSGLPSFVGFHSDPASEQAASNAATRALYANASPSVLASKLAPVSNAPTTAPNVPTPNVNLTQAPIMGHSEGGYMKRKKGRQRFDDGGDVDYSGSNDYASDPITVDPSYLDPATFDQSSGGPYLNNEDYLNAELQDPNFFSDVGDNYNSTVAGGNSGSALSNLKANATGANGVSGILQILAGLTPIASALMRPKTNTNSPTAAPGMTQGATAPRAPMFNRTQNMSPTNSATGAPMTQQDWYTYGSRPEAQFFQNNSVPLAQATGVATGQARGGALSSLSKSRMFPDESSFGMPEFDSAVEHHVEGPGDGTSDDIPAKLSDGEYVMDANTVSMLGNGSNKAGAARLDALRENLRKHASKSMAKGKQFMKAKAPEQYMKGGAKK